MHIALTLRNGLFVFLDIAAASALLQKPLGAPDDSVETHQSAFSSQFDTLAQDSLDYFHVPGISIAVVHADNIHVKVCLTPLTIDLFSVPSAAGFPTPGQRPKHCIIPDPPPNCLLRQLCPY